MSDQKKRTDWAEDRTLLANERTFSSWMGTGLASVGVAIGLHAVFRSIEPDWPVKIVITVFLITAIVIFWSAAHQAKKTYDRLNDTDAETQPHKNFSRLATMMTIGAVGVGIILWVL